MADKPGRLPVDLASFGPAVEDTRVIDSDYE